MVNNDYMGCDFYQNQAQNANKEGFATFFDSETAKFYFALVNSTTKKVIFRSEGYPTAAAQQTGLNSVIKNIKDEKRFSILEETGSFFVILKAGNRVEIARSCPFTTKAEAENTIGILTGKVEEVAPKVTTKAIKTIVANKEIKATAKVVATKKATTKAEKVVTVAPEKAVKTAKKQVENTIEFAPTSAYLGHETLSDAHGKTGYALFSNDQKHYFVVYNADGSIFQRSYAFGSTAERDTYFEALQTAIVNEDTYQITENNFGFQVQITDASGKTLSASETFESFTQAFQKTPKGWSQPTEMVGTMY
jgi:uncharacterized protein YegP (UPF0339 family)